MNQKILVLCGLVVISLMQHAYAGQKEGNGGGAWGCGHDSGHDFDLIDFVDLYEGREEFHLNIPQRTSQNYREILDDIKVRLLSINEKFGETISRYISDIMSSLSFTNGVLTIVDDALYRIQPPDSICRNGYVQYRQVANFTHYGKTLIQKMIWDEKFSELQRAALIFHEALYKYAREIEKDTNSVRTREAVAHIFSDMDKDGLRNKLLKDGWFDSGPETRTTNTGAIFTRDRSHAALNEAWRDPDGLIWGDIVKNEDGTVRRMIQSSEYMKETGRPLPNGTLGAKEYCEIIGAHLPSKEEFTRLREYMGARSGTDEGYSHHDNKILPNLSDYRFWSSWVYSDNIDIAYVFDGRHGYFHPDYRYSNSAVRCVVSR